MNRYNVPYSHSNTQTPDVSCVLLFKDGTHKKETRVPGKRLIEKKRRIEMEDLRPSLLSFSLSLPLFPCCPFFIWKQKQMALHPDYWREEKGAMLQGKKRAKKNGMYKMKDSGFRLTDGHSLPTDRHTRRGMMCFNRKVSLSLTHTALFSVYQTFHSASMFHKRFLYCTVVRSCSFRSDSLVSMCVWIRLTRSSTSTGHRERRAKLSS